jgi:(R)-2-hydroxyacyl-CoA dehydratese activating ATPase
MHFLGIDLGSSYTKLVVLDHGGTTVHEAVLPTRSRRRDEFDRELAEIRARFDIRRVCTTGYGRRAVESDMQKTELVCAAAGVSALHPVHKNVLDIGGEDIKIIECDADGGVVDFSMNDKCAAGTGVFITEIAMRAELDPAEMSDLARKSGSDRVMNSFCTVFAMSEILGWKLSGIPIEEIARGIYLSVVDRVRRLPIRKGLPLFLCGGVIAYHPVLAELLAERVHVDVHIVDRAQYAVALGAAALALREMC